MTETKEEERDYRESVERPEIFKLMFSTKFIFGAILIYAGIGIPFLLKTQSDITALFKEFGPTTLGVLVAFIGVTMAFSEMNRVKRLRREDRFVDVDESRGSEEYKFQKRILNELNSLKAKSDGLSPEGVEDIVSKMIEAKAIDQESMYDSFEDYFNEIRRVLLEQAHTSDKKASILLDKGTAYSKGGITFFISSIIAWQILAWLTEFQEQYIYGIISCSLLFIFIEFLAAWFLKQYRHFVDTSTYHIKVKSIFDKYMMSYLAIKSLSGSEGSEEAKYQAMLKILEEEIKWPETYLLKSGDVSFAKEALETMTHFAKAMRSEAKNQGK
ncbi:hypothetical protein [Halopseudomonas oceani]|uniref:hypothetical protein n=1 Tax=Halopseudomonas oceani TaxID=1708783 RepID=UPI002AA67DAA|nr:hypothetical protein [Halopseudomonas oceani]